MKPSTYACIAIFFECCLQIATSKCTFGSEFVGLWGFERNLEANNTLLIKVESHHIRLEERVEDDSFDIFKNSECHAAVAGGDHPKYIIKYTSANEVYYACIQLSVNHENIVSFKQGNVVKSPNPQCPPSMRQSQLLVKRGDVAHAVEWPQILQGEFSVLNYLLYNDACDSDPVNSTLHSCASNSTKELHLRDCHGRSTVLRNELKCIGSWTHDQGYLIIARSGWNTYQCMYARLVRSTGHVLLKSALNPLCANALGTEAAEEYTLMKTVSRREPITTARCEFPSWLTSMSRWSHARGTTHYQLTDGGSRMVTHEDGQGVIEWRTCHERRQRVLVTSLSKIDDVIEYQIVTQVALGCSRGYQCMRFVHRSPSVAQLTQGSVVQNPYIACSPEHMAGKDTELLITQLPAPIPCPMEGMVDLLDLGSTSRHATSVRACSMAKLSFGCHRKHAMTIECDSKQESFTCQATWKEGEATYLVVFTEEDSLRANLFRYQELYDNTLNFKLDTTYNSRAVYQFKEGHIPQPPFKFASVESCPSMSSLKSGSTSMVHTFTTDRLATMVLLLLLPTVIKRWLACSA